MIFDLGLVKMWAAKTGGLMVAIPKAVRKATGADRARMYYDAENCVIILELYAGDRRAKSSYQPTVREEYEKQKEVEMLKKIEKKSRKRG